jgi:hypothetical protein
VSARAFGSLNVLPTSNSNFSIEITGEGKMKSTLETSSELSLNTIENISSLYEFELQLDLSALDIGGDTFNVSLNGNKTIMVRVEDDGSGEFRISLMTISEGSNIFNQTIAAGLPPKGTYSINLLDEMYKFSTDILATAETPFSLAYNGTANGVFTVGCYNYSTDNEDISFGLGTIEYQSENAYFVDQAYSYQGGAIIIGQEDGEAIISPPFFSVDNDTTNHLISFSIVDVLGLPGKRGASGYGTYAIRTNYSTIEQETLIAHTIYLNITTDYPTAWERYINATLNATGLDLGQDYEINTTQHYLVLTLYGPKKLETETDLVFYLSKISIYAQVGPGWVS